MTSTPADVLTEWLTTRPTEARVAITVDTDRLLSDSGILGREKVDDKSGRQWQLVVFRGDDLAFRLRFRKAFASPPVLIALTRGAGTDGSIDVSLVTDILSKNESGEPLDLSLVAFFRRFCPQINLPPLELRRYKDILLSRLDGVPGAAAGIIERWGRPDDWGRGQIAAMVILAGHPEMTLQDLWPDEPSTVEFLVHALRLTLASLHLVNDREVLLDIIREAARPQVRQCLQWLRVPPEELAAFLVLRDFAGKNKLQNPNNQLSGLHIFSPETPLSELEPLAERVATVLRGDEMVWGRVNRLAERFLTPRRVQKVMGLLPEIGCQSKVLTQTILSHDTAPTILKQHLKLFLLKMFENLEETSLGWVGGLRDHPLIEGAIELLSPRAIECRGGLLFLLAARDIETQLAEVPPTFPHFDSLLDWYLKQGHHHLELDLYHALHNLETFADEEVIGAGYQYFFGGANDLSPSEASLKGRLRDRLDSLDNKLGDFVSGDPIAFAQSPRSTLHLLREQLGQEVRQIIEGISDGRIWILVFDGMRYDTWDTVVRPILAEFFSIDGKAMCCVLPSFTQISRTSFFAGSLATEWRNYNDAPTRNEIVLAARSLGLTREEQNTKLRFVTEADTVNARGLMGTADGDAKEVNVLIYPISDECHDFRGDLAAFNNKIRTDILGDKTQGVRGILDDLLRRVAPEDKVLLTSDHGFVELLASDAVTITRTEIEETGGDPQDDVRYRYLKGISVGTPGRVAEISYNPETYHIVVGRQWFRREGVTNPPRYDHGGISLAEMVVPGFLLRRVTEKKAQVEITGLDVPVVLVDEDGQAELGFNLENSGNVQVEFDIRVMDNLVEELYHHQARLAPHANYPVKINIVGKYQETPSREVDPNRTLTALTLKLRHTDSKGTWRDAVDGSVILPVRVIPKKTRLVTDALKGLDEV